MKRILTVVVLLCSVILLGAFTLAENAITYKVDNQRTNIVWFAKKVGGVHSGTLKISEGYITIKGDNLVGGSFEIDMNSITVSDIKDTEKNVKLVENLKSDNFFDTAIYPTAKFIITKTKKLAKEQYMVFGNLTIRGVTHPIQFPAIVSVSDNQTTLAVMTNKIVVDRTMYGIKYRSHSFFAGLGDRAISDDFEVEVTQMIARRQ